jgi:hypothetical protein
MFLAAQAAARVNSRGRQPSEFERATRLFSPARGAPTALGCRVGCVLYPGADRRRLLVRAAASPLHNRSRPECSNVNNYRAILTKAFRRKSIDSLKMR